MATTIENFFNQASQKQFARDFLFRVKQISVTGLSLNGETDLIYAKTAMLPGRTIENKVVNYSGQQFNIPGKSSYPGSESYSIEFYVDQSLEIRDKLEQASRTLFNNESTTGNLNMPGNESTITLDILRMPNTSGSGSSAMETFRTINLIGASLRTISDISYAIADGTGEVLTFTAAFAYHYYEER